VGSKLVVMVLVSSVFPAAGSGSLTHGDVCFWDM
jgi:hypothetical protein